MPGYFPKGGGWPAIAKTTPGLIRGSVYKQLDRYVPSMNGAILSQLKMLEFENGGKLHVSALYLGRFSVAVGKVLIYFRMHHWLL